MNYVEFHYIYSFVVLMVDCVTSHPMTIQVNINSQGVVRSYNLYPNHSSRTNLQNPIIPFGNIKW